METKIRVLIADPNEDFQLLMKNLLSHEADMEAAGTSSDGSDALAKIEALHPDVVLLELVQPRLDGMGVLRKLAEKESAPPVLVLTGFVNAHVVAECANLGAAYFMSKPCDTAELMQRLRQSAQTGRKPLPVAGSRSPAAAAPETKPLPAGAQLDLDITKPWPSDVESLRVLFLTQPPYEPLSVDGYVFVRAAMAEETGIDHCAVGIRAENGEVTGVCYAIPMVYSPEPPAGLEGYRWIGDQNRGWWTTCDDLTEKSSDP